MLKNVHAETKLYQNKKQKKRQIHEDNQNNNDQLVVEVNANDVTLTPFSVFMGIVVLLESKTRPSGGGPYYAYV